VNGTSYILASNAQSLANYPHARMAGGMLYISGVSSRRPDNTHVGAEPQEDGSFQLDIRKQTRAVIKSIASILKTAGCDLGHLVDITVFLVDMSDYGGMNEVYNEFFDAESGPTRTTVAVRQLPHPNLLVEMKAVAVAPGENRE